MPSCKLIFMFSGAFWENSFFSFIIPSIHLSCFALPVLLPLWTHTRNMCTHWLGKQQPCGSVVRSRRGDSEGVARQRQPGNSQDRWVGSGAGDRGHTCCLPSTHTFLIHSETQPLHQPPCRSLLHTHLHSWFYLFCCSFLESWPEANCALVVNRFK